MFSLFTPAAETETLCFGPFSKQTCTDGHKITWATPTHDGKQSEEHKVKKKRVGNGENGRPVSHTSASGGDSQTLATGVSVCHCLSEGTGGGVPRESPRVCLAWHSKGLCNYKTNKVGASRNREVGPWGGTPRAWSITVKTHFTIYDCVPRSPHQSSVKYRFSFPR